MTVFNFPDTAGQPTDGSFVWTAPNGTLYVWDGNSWTTLGGSGTGGGGDAKIDVTDDLTTISNPSQGDLAYHTEEARMYIYYEDNDSKQWVDASPGGDSIDSGGGGASQYWDRLGTTLTPKVADDDLNIGAGDITAADGSFTGDISADKGVFASDIIVNNTVFADDIIADKGDFTGDISADNGGFTGDVSANNGIFAGDIQSTSQNGGQLAGFRNKIINGDFGVNQRGSVFSIPDNNTPNIIYTLDRWGCSNKGVIATVEQDLQTAGAMDSRYGLRTNIGNGGGGTNNYLTIVQKIEDCFSVQSEFTISFKAKASKAMSIGVEITRSYGSGGSSTDTALITEKVDLTTSFKKYTVTATMPSLSGKTLGSDTGDIGLFFWMTAGTDYNDRASSIGLQTGTVDLADIQVEPGPVATSFEHRSIGTELALCQRYFIHTTNQHAIWTGMTVAGRGYSISADYPVQMRVTPTIENVTSQDSQDFLMPALNVATINSATFVATANAAADANYYWVGFDANAEL